MFPANPDPMGHADPSLLAVDPSISYCGLAIAQMVNPLDQFILASGVFTPNREQGDANRVAALGAAIKVLAREWNVQRIVVETPTTLYVKKGRSLDALKLLLVIGAVYAAGGFLGVPVYGMTVKQWKGGGTQHKEHTLALAQALWPHDKMQSDDEAEARLLALAVVQPDEVRAAIGILKLGAPVDRAVGALRRTWQWGPREIGKIESMLGRNRLTGTAKTRKRGRG
ncbi:hypothetical protein LCGC14_1281610 [marine sediment metagenome]|uniref:Uncharacterized protein n=1 Tax=marine sediment metagenome TaxID=412755 RepID=A0A0F9KWN6_9ZZZZ